MTLRQRLCALRSLLCAPAAAPAPTSTQELLTVELTPAEVRAVSFTLGIGATVLEEALRDVRERYPPEPGVQPLESAAMKLEMALLVAGEEM